MLRLASFLMLAGLLGACASTAGKARFSLTLNASQAEKGMVWPAESTGQVPRYFYLGALVGEPNFVKPEPVPGSVRSFLSALAGFVFGEEPPLVLDRPQSGCVDESGRIYVSDIGRAGIFVFDEQLGQLAYWDRAEEFTSFRTPVGIAVGPEGQIFVTDADLGFVARLDRQGRPMKPIGKGQLSRPTGLVYEAISQRLYVTDTPAHQVKVFDLEGRLLSTIGTFGEGLAELNYPTHLAVRDGLLYVSDTLNARIQVFSVQDGRHVRQIGKRGLFIGDLVRPKGVATDSEHNIYVVESNHDYLLIYNRLGAFLMAIGGVGSGVGNFYLPAGVWLDERNRIFVADMLNSRVAVYQFLGGDGEIQNE